MLVKNLTAYLEMCCTNYNLALPDKQKVNVVNHLVKGHSLVLAVIKVYLILINLLSLLIFRSRFYKLKHQDKNRIRKILNIFNFLLWFIDNLLFAIISAHTYGQEEVSLLETITKSGNKIQNQDFFEFLVIGSGPAGSVTATKIAQQYPGKVAILERGEHFALPRTKHPGQEFSKKWRNGGISSTFFPNLVSFSSGNCLGGGSEINSGLFHPPDRDFLECWSETYKALNLSMDSIKPFLAEVRKMTSLQKTHNLSHFEKEFINSAKKNGFSWERLNRFIDKRTKQSKNSMTKTYLKIFVKNEGKVFTKTNVKNFFREGDFWKVVVEQDNIPKTIKCRNLFLCCGAMNTNSLLLKSPVSYIKPFLIATDSTFELVESTVYIVPP